jgi:eukaryotic-like serine/threonine-protein kinase
MRLTSPQIERIQQTIGHAYNREEFRRALRLCMDESFDYHVPDKAFADQLWALIEWADRQGLVMDLVRCAYENNENNTELALLWRDIQTWQVQNPGLDATIDYGDKKDSKPNTPLDGILQPARGLFHRLALPTESQQRKNRAVMLRRVQSFWVEGVLERSLHGAALLELGLVDRPGDVTYPLAMLVHQKGEDRQLPPGTKVIDVFDKHDGSLLILGAPGSGKTTLLIDLARILIARAEKDNSCPIPVVFNLSSWAQKRQPLQKWLVDELNIRYGVPRKFGLLWLHSEQLLPLLDSLDEVEAKYRGACVETINEYLADRGLNSLVVCCRMLDYEALQTRLCLQCAVLLQSITYVQIDTYLAALGDRLANVRAMLCKDRELQEFARSPLMLNLLILGFVDTPVHDLPYADSIRDWHQHVFANYVERMFTCRAQDKRYSTEDAYHWLGWLARQMQQRSQALFMLDQLQPNWLAAKGERFTYMLLSRACTGMILGIIVGGAAGLNAILSLPDAPTTGDYTLFAVVFVVGMLAAIFGSGINALLEYVRNERLLERGVWHIPSYVEVLQWLCIVGVATVVGVTLFVGILITLFGGVAQLLHGRDVAIELSPSEGFLVALTFGIYSLIVLTPICGVRGGMRTYLTDIKTGDAFRFSVRYGLAGILVGALIGLGMVMLSPYRDNPTDWLSYCMRYALLGMLLLGLRSRKVETWQQPNAGIRRAAQKAIILSALSMTILTISGFALGGMASAAWGALVIGLLIFAWFGGIDVVQHYVLRALLVRSNNIPWKYADFLDFAVEHVLMQRVGSGYIFMHRSLLEYFADLHSAPVSPK